MIPRHCALCGLVANRNEKPFVIFMTLRVLDVDFIGACKAHMVLTANLIHQEPDVEHIKTFYATDFRVFDVAVSS